MHRVSMQSPATRPHEHRLQSLGSNALLFLLEMFLDVSWERTAWLKNNSVSSKRLQEFEDLKVFDEATMKLLTHPWVMNPWAVKKRSSIFPLQKVDVGHLGGAEIHVLSL